MSSASSNYDGFTPSRISPWSGRPIRRASFMTATSQRWPERREPMVIDFTQSRQPLCCGKSKIVHARFTIGIRGFALVRPTQIRIRRGGCLRRAAVSGQRAGYPAQPHSDRRGAFSLTEQKDRGKKFTGYRGLNSLEGLHTG